MPPPRSCASRAWRCVLALALVATLTTSHLVAAPARLADAADSEWIPPVPGVVVAPFREPVSRYGAGHRGVDFAAAPGSPVQVSNDGTVVFAGTVAGALHVVVSHTGGIRTSYSFLERVDVMTGQRVRRGQVVGAAGGTGDGHGPGVLHFGVRIGDRYVDPMLLFRPRDLTEMVRLVPAPERAAASRQLSLEDARRMLTGLDHGGPLDDAVAAADDVVSDAVELGEAGLRALGQGVDWTVDASVRAFETGVHIVIEVGGDIGAFVLARLDQLRATVSALTKGLQEVIRLGLTPYVALVNALAELGADVAERLFACPQPDSRTDQPKTESLVIGVGGRDSSRKRRKDGSVTRSFDFEWQRLGYRAGNVSYFSYSARSETYTAAQTRGDLHAQARRLGAQIRTQAAAHPGKPIDLVGHSQGGVVIAIFLQEVYRGHEDEYPPIANVITFASPLRGTPTANLGVAGGKNVGNEIYDFGEAFNLRTVALHQLCEGSRTIRNLWKQPAPSTVRFLSISGMEDLVVPSPSTEVPGGRSVVVQAGDPFVPDDHTAILRDDDAISAAQAHLRGEEPGGCGAFAGSWGEGWTDVVHAATEAAKATSAQKEIPRTELPSTKEADG